MSFCRSSVLSCIIVATVLSGCSSLKNKKPEEPVQSGVITPPAAKNSTEAGDNPASAAAGTDNLQGNSMDDGADTGAEGSKNAKGKKSGKRIAGKGADSMEVAGQLKSIANTIFFAFDDYTLSADDQAILSELAQRLKAEPGLKVELYGHADERGTINYNLALGEKRGNAVEAYLRAIGINGNRLEVISYGETKPLDDGHDDDAWAHNRRVEIVVTR